MKHYQCYVGSSYRLDLELKGNKNTVGLARMGICGHKSKCSVIEDNGLGSGLIIVHEAGHT